MKAKDPNLKFYYELDDLKIKPQKFSLRTQEVSLYVGHLGIKTVFESQYKEIDERHRIEWEIPPKFQNKFYEKTKIHL